MTVLEFKVLEVVAQEHAASPHLLFRIRLTESSAAVVHALALRCQLRFEPQRRGYVAAEQEGLADLFGTSDRYGTTLKPFLWTYATAMVQGFQHETAFDLPVPCTYDFDVAGTKYLHALRDGSAPLALLFSGTVFTRGESGFSVEQLSWSLEAPCLLPVSVWRELMDHYFPGGGWIRLNRDTLDALVSYKSAHGLTSLDQTILQVLPTAVTTS